MHAWNSDAHMKIVRAKYIQGKDDLSQSYYEPDSMLATVCTALSTVTNLVLDPSVILISVYMACTASLQQQHEKCGL